MNSDVFSQLSTQTAWLGDSVSVESGKVKGKLCINSTDQAPAFSRWKMCGLNSFWAKWIYGAEQSELTINLDSSDE